MLEIFKSFKSATSEFIYKTIPDQYRNSNTFSKGSMLICGSAAAEMAILSIFSGIDIIRNGTNETKAYNLSANMGGAFYYGISSLNPMQGSAALAGLMFSSYSMFMCPIKSDPSSNKSFLMTEIVGRGLNVTIITLKSVTCDIIKNYFEDFIIPVVKRITTIAIPIFNNLFNLIPMPKHVIWIPVVLLVTALVISKVLYPLIKAAPED